TSEAVPVAHHNAHRVDLLIRLLGTLAGALGAWIVVMGGTLVIDSVIRWTNWFDVAFSAVFMLIPLALGVYLVAVAVRLWRPVTVGAIRHLVGLLAVMFWIWLSVTLTSLVGDNHPGLGLVWLIAATLA